MIYLILFLSLLFVSIGYMVTEKNAKYLLSGYNTMNEAERQNVDIQAYIPWFRKFHIGLGISFFVIGLALTYFAGTNVGGVFITVYPIAAYVFFIASSSKYFKGKGQKRNRVGILLLTVILVFVLALLGYGYTENGISVDRSGVSIHGVYGEFIQASEIGTVEFVTKMPDIGAKTNGFALGSIKKGHFKIENGEVVKLVLNGENHPAILLIKTDGDKIYYAPKTKSSIEIVDEMKKNLPNIQYR